MYALSQRIRWDVDLSHDSVLALAAELRREAERCRSSRKLGVALSATAMALYQKGLAIEAIAPMDSALMWFEHDGYTFGRMNALVNSALVLAETGRIATCIDRLSQALILAEKLGNEEVQITVLGNIGALYQILGEEESARVFLQRGLDLGNSAGMQEMSGYMQASLAQLDLKQGRLEEARGRLVRVDSIVRALGIKELEAIVHMMEGMAALTEGRAGAALLQYQKADSLCRQMALGRLAAHVEVGLARTMLALGDAAAAKGHAMQALTWCRTSFDPSAKLEALEVLYTVEKGTGSLERALALLEERSQLKDTLSAERRRSAISALHQEYDRRREEREREARQAVRDLRQRTIRNSIAAGLMASLVVLLLVVRQRSRIAREKARSDALLLNILPHEVADELKLKGHAEARHFEEATILFTDFKGFTELSQRVTPAELVEELNACFKAFDAIIGKYGIEKIKTIGDAYMAAGGLPVPNTHSVADTVRAALEMQTFIRDRKVERDAQGLPAFAMRVGIHTGPVVAGIVGVKKFQYDIWGDTVNTASRMESSGEVGKVNISEATYRAIKDDPAFSFTSRGLVSAKGKGEMEMWFVERYEA